MAVKKQNLRSLYCGKNISRKMAGILFSQILVLFLLFAQNGKNLIFYTDKKLY